MGSSWSSDSSWSSLSSPWEVRIRDINIIHASRLNEKDLIVVTKCWQKYTFFKVDGSSNKWQDLKIDFTQDITAIFVDSVTQKMYLFGDVIAFIYDLSILSAGAGELQWDAWMNQFTWDGWITLFNFKYCREIQMIAIGNSLHILSAGNPIAPFTSRRIVHTIWHDFRNQFSTNVKNIAFMYEYHYGYLFYLFPVGNSDLGMLMTKMVNMTDAAIQRWNGKTEQWNEDPVCMWSWKEQERRIRQNQSSALSTVATDDGRFIIWFGSSAGIMIFDSLKHSISLSTIKIPQSLNRTKYRAVYQKYHTDEWVVTTGFVRRNTRTSKNNNDSYYYPGCLVALIRQFFTLEYVHLISNARDYRIHLDEVLNETVVYKR